MLRFLHIYLASSFPLFYALCLGFGFAEAETYSWTMLLPEHDSRDPEMRDFDDFSSRSQLDSINKSERFLHHHLVWQEMPLANLLSNPPPFCELDFDGVRSQILTNAEKSILREYFSRGGFILFHLDAYPYPQDVFWKVHSWPIIDFLIKELHASSQNFKSEKITESHVLFRFYHRTKIPDVEKHELQGNPNSPYLLLISYRGRPCAFVEAQYTWLENNKWVALQRPFDRGLPGNQEGYDLVVNLYAYVMTH